MGSQAVVLSPVTWPMFPYPTWESPTTTILSALSEIILPNRELWIVKPEAPYGSVESLSPPKKSGNRVLLLISGFHENCFVCNLQASKTDRELPRTRAMVATFLRTYSSVVRPACARWQGNFPHSDDLGWEESSTSSTSRQKSNFTDFELCISRSRSIARTNGCWYDMVWQLFIIGDFYAIFDATRATWHCRLWW